MEKLLDVQLCECPVTVIDYHSFDISQLPKVVLGFQIKNQFDEQRYCFKPEYNAKKIVHFYTPKKNELEPVFFYGIELEVDQTKYYKMLFALDNFIGACKPFKSFFEQYKNFIKEYGLTCDDCYHYLKDGIYPIDLKHLSTLIKQTEKIPIHNLSNMLIINPEQWYLNIGAFGIYVLTTSSFYYSQF